MTLQNSSDGSIAPATSPLRSNSNFRWLWGSGAFETLGDTTLRTIVPIIAVSLLGAGSIGVGLLNALSLAAFLVLGIPAGTLVDRWNKKRILIVSSLGRALLVLMIPVAFLVDALSFELLMCLVALAGIFDVFFTTAHATIVPSILNPVQISVATAQLHATQSVVSLAGPGIVSLLLKFFSAPLGLVASSFAYLFSALLIGRIQSQQPPVTSAARHSLWTEAKQGFSYCVTHRVLRSMMFSTMLINAGAMFANAASAVFALTYLQLKPSSFALLGSFAALGGLIGSLIAPVLLRCWGIGRTKIFASLAALPTVGLYPLAGELPFSSLVWLGISSFGWSFLVVIHAVAGSDVIPKLTEARMLGRVTASNRFFILGMMPLASIAGGFTAALFGPVCALWIWAVLAALSALPIALSPIRSWRQVPDTEIRI